MKLASLMVLIGLIIIGVLFFFFQNKNDNLLELERRIVAGLTERFLLTYESKDAEGLIQLFDKNDDVVFYGIDLGDKARDFKNIKTHFTMLFSAIETLRLRSSKPDIVEISDDGKMATVFCEVPVEIVLKANRNDPLAVILRFILVWKKTNRLWRIREAGIFLATSGKSARDLSR